MGLERTNLGQKISVGSTGLSTNLIGGDRFKNLSRNSLAGTVRIVSYQLRRQTLLTNILIFKNNIYIHYFFFNNITPEIIFIYFIYFIYFFYRSGYLIAIFVSNLSNSSFKFRYNNISFSQSI